ncbi:MAG: serine/threonine-protein kinase [Desulfuromonadales bacterium]
MKLPKNILSGWPVAAVLTLVILALSLTEWGPLQSLEHKSYDLRARMRQKKPDVPVVIVAIDDASIEKMGRWPWPRAYMADMISLIAGYGPSLMALNILYTEPDRSSGLEEIRGLRDTAEKSGVTSGALYSAILETEKKLDNDGQLTRAIAEAKNVILPLYFTIGDQAAASDANTPPFLIKSSRENASPAGTLQGKEVTPPIPVFSDAALLLGHVNVVADEDGTVRREPLLIHYQGRSYPSLALQAALRYLNIKPAEISTAAAGKLQAGRLSIPTDSKGRMLISYNGRFNSFTYYSFVDVVSGAVPASAFKGRIVLVGPIATGIAGFSVTPVQASFPAVEIAANVIENLLSNNVLARPAWMRYIESAFILLVGGFLAFALPRMKAGISALVSTCILLLWNSAAVWLFVSQGEWLGMVAPSLLLVIGYTVNVSTRFMVTEKGKELVESDSIETSKMLGLSFQGQGLLDLAFEKFRKCPIEDATVKDLLYNLALDFERKRMFNKAAAVYEHIQTAGEYKDIKERIGTMKQAGETMIFGAPGGRKENTVILQGGGAAMPTIGRYEIQKELGRGAMGTVYLGKDPKINRLVAIKTIRFDEIEQEQIQNVKQRFFREAEAAGALNHPNIVTIYDVGEDYDLAYVAMELLDGSDLCDFVKPTDRLPFAEVLRIVGCVAEGLDFAHARGIVHRDIKPANIMRLKNGDIKIADFGIARITASSSTQTGMILGTPSYMSPEQVVGQKVDGRSDLFSLGVAMYEMLCCRKPFSGDSITNIMFNIANKPPLLLTQIDPQIPQCCAFIAHKLLMKDISKRYQTGREVADHCGICRQKLG